MQHCAKRPISVWRAVAAAIDKIEAQEQS